MAPPKCISSIASAYPALVMKRGYARAKPILLMGARYSRPAGAKRIDIVTRDSHKADLSVDSVHTPFGRTKRAPAAPETP